MKLASLFALLLVAAACGKEDAAPTAKVAATKSDAASDTYYCPDVYAPVCANGVTYPNACYASKAGVTNYTRGACGGDL